MKQLKLFYEDIYYGGVVQSFYLNSQQFDFSKINPRTIKPFVDYNGELIFFTLSDLTLDDLEANKMEIGDVVSKEYLVEKGYAPLWSKDVDTVNEIDVYHHKGMYQDVKIQRVPEMPEVYMVMLVLPLKPLRAKFTVGGD